MLARSSTLKANIAMADDDFEPRLGRMHSRGGMRGRRYLQRVLAATSLARGAGALGARTRRRFDGSHIGRGAGVGRVLRARGVRSVLFGRRVVIKSRIVKLAGKGAASAAAHLRYLQRDATTRGGERGRLYAAGTDEADGRAFRGRGEGDRHQFRFIVSAEDGAEYDDLKPLTRRLMARMEEDLGTKLDWVAVDHFDTGHPHTHIIVRGVDHRGADLVIARDYLTRGMRERAAEIVDLDLGPRSTREVSHRLRLEVDQERLTSIDRALLAAADDQGLVDARGAGALDQSLRAGRLAKLVRLGLATPEGHSRWRLDPELSDTLRRMGERGDIIRTMQRVFAERSVLRAAADRVIYDPAAGDPPPLVGRVLARGLSDEHSDRHFLIVDGLDGRSHYVDIGKASAGEIGEGAIVRLQPVQARVREVDRTVAAVASANEGRYDVDAHLAFESNASEAFAETHVRRLEAMRRLTGRPVREPSGVWQIGPDHLERAAAFEAAPARAQPVVVTSLSPAPLEHLASADAATWLDRRLVARNEEPARDAGFGAEVRSAESARRRWLVEQGLASTETDEPTYPSDLIDRLRRRELLRVAGQLSEELDLPFGEARPGERLEGMLRRRLDLISGRFALVERSRDFTLVPWRPVLERQMGKPVGGIMRADGVSWAVRRGRGPAVGE
jgi:type IV secretory pathway VirD2 relaxase